jgi:hypothetical protein
MEDSTKVLIGVLGLFVLIGALNLVPRPDRRQPVTQEIYAQLVAKCDDNRCQSESDRRFCINHVNDSYRIVQ